MTRLRVIDEAEQDLLEAMEWYEARRTGLGDEFSEAYEAGLRSIVRSPTSFAPCEVPRVARHFRRCFLKRFPYSIVFELVGDEIVVVSVAHAKRRFAFWRHRRT